MAVSNPAAVVRVPCIAAILMIGGPMAPRPRQGGCDWPARACDPPPPETEGNKGRHCCGLSILANAGQFAELSSS